AFAFCTSSASVYILLGCGLDDAGRYATPLMLALPFVFAALCTVVSMGISTSWKREGQRGASLIVLFAVLLLYLGAQVWTYGLTDAGSTFQSNYCPIEPANNDPIIAYMQQKHIHYFWANNFL